MFTRLLVPIEGNTHSEAVLEAARELALLTGASVHLLHLALHEWIEQQDVVLEDTVATSRFVDQARHAFTQAGIETTAEVLPADVRDLADEILKRAEPGPDTLIVLGSPHRPRWIASLGGTIGNTLARTSHCPILLIP